MKKTILSIGAVITALAVTASGACAKAWIQLSKWAYNDVSSYVSEGLLPEKLENVSDFTQPINRMDFCEVLYSALKKASIINDSLYYFEDCPGNEAVNSLGANYIVSGVREEEGEHGQTIHYFAPEENITRQDAAVILDNAAEKYASPGRFGDKSGNMTEFVSSPQDYDDISDYAQTAVNHLMFNRIMNCMGDNKFMPKENLTIEQAVCIISRFYRMLPTAPPADGSNIHSDGEALVQTYANGVTETKVGALLKIGNYMEFETDIYSNIFCATNNGNVIITAQNYNNASEVYNAADKKLLFTVPYNVFKTDDRYIYTKSSKIGPMSYGLYDYSGKEVLKPEYSLDEIDYLIANNFTPPQEEKRAADGWIYYADWTDGGKMYKVDTNGENKQKLSDNDCFNIKYYDGWLYYSIRGEDENKLFCIKADGTCEERLSDNKARLADYDVQPMLDGFVFAISDNVSLTHVGEYVIYTENCGESRFENNIMAVRHTPDGTEKKQLLSNTTGATVLPVDDSRALMSSITNLGDIVERKVYLWDGETTKCISGSLSVTSYMFDRDTEKVIYKTKDGKYYESVLDGKEPVPSDYKEPEEEPYDPAVFKRPYKNTSLCEDISDDTYQIKREYTLYDDDYTKDFTELYVESGGEKRTIASGRYVSAYRTGNMVYCLVYPQSSSINTELCSYNLETGKYTLISDTVRTGLRTGDGWMMYTANTFNTCIARDGGEKTAEVYPNKGFYRYGELKYLILDNKGRLVKVDTNGNLFAVTGEQSTYFQYVKNGEKSSDRKVFGWE